MNIRLKSRLILTLSALGFMIFESLGFTVVVNLSGSNEYNSFYLINLIITFLLIGVVNIIYSKQIKLFKTDPTKIEDDEIYKKHLESLGALPLKSLVRFLLLVIIIQIGTNIHLRSLGLGRGSVNAFTGLMFSLGMLTASFIYVLFDRTILNWLYKNSVLNYPENIKSNRQRVKGIIIPIFMALMSTSVTFFLCFITLTNVPKGTEDILGFLIKGTLPSLIVIMGIILMLVFIWSKSTNMLYQNLINRLDDMVSGDKDVTKRIIISSVDEIGLISNKVNQFSHIISEHLRETNSMISEQSAENDSLLESVLDSTKHVASIGAKIEETIAIVKSNDQIVNETFITGKELINNSGDVANQVEIQSMSVTESSAAVEEMIASINEVTKRTAIVRERTTELSEDFKIGQSKIRATVDSVNHVVELSKSLMDINGVISGIAARTNLLAMNAAIEAAHAGEAGKGFSVVADEIRKLAENTSKQTKTSSQNLKDILKEINTSLTIATETGETFDKMNRDLIVVENETHSIASAMEEHDKANNQVLEQLSSTTNLSNRLTDISAELTKLGNSMLTCLEELELGSKSSLDNAVAVKESNDQIKLSMERLNSVATATNSINKRTKELVGSFKV